MVNSRSLGTLVTGLVFLGCGSTTDGTDATAGAARGGSASAGDDGATINGGASNHASGSGGGSGTGATSGGPTGTGGANNSQADIGTLQIARFLTPTPGSTVASAQFDLVEQAAWDALSNGQSCPRETYGACVLTKCSGEAMEPDPNHPAPTSVDRLDAGTITVTADVGGFSSTGTPTNINHGYSFDSKGSLGGGELVTMSASGGRVPAFSGKVQLPLAPFLLTPAVEGTPGAVDVPVSRTADFTFSWDARGASDRLVVYLSSESPRLSCTFDASAGTGTLQVGALSQLSAGTRIRLFGVKSVKLETAGGVVQLLAAFETISTDKASFPSFVLE